MALITGSTGNDSLVGTNNADIISALAGNDTINPRLGLDVVDGSTGTDLLIVDYSAVSGNIESDFSGGAGTITAVDSIITNQVSYTGIELLRLTGTQQADSLVGTTGADTLNGNGGDDLIYAGGELDQGGLPSAYTGISKDIIHGGLGTDTLNGADFSAETTGLTIDESGALVGTAGRMQVDGIERFAKVATGSGADHITFASQFDNTIFTGAGNDTIDAGLGTDAVDGGADGDTLVVDYSGVGVAVTATVGAGNSGVVTGGANSVTYTGIEALDINGSGLDDNLVAGGGNDSLHGNGGADTLSGGLGNDLLDGGTGIDSLVGGDGDDTYVVTTGDVIVENASEGHDLVKADFTFTLGNNLEDLTLTGTANIDGTGNELANHLIGNDGDNLLAGGGDADTLEGGIGKDTLDGGAGIDSLVGGQGDDTYIVGTGDVIVEAAGEGTDTVQSSTTYSLVDGVSIENLTLTGTGDADATGNNVANYITGNTGKNLLTGNDGADTLDGGGGGLDTLAGGDGNDTYIAVTGDTIVEAAGQGTDTVKAATSFTLSTGASIENLTLTGTADIDGTGNDVDNHITGNSGANVLTGGLGADTLEGGTGDDTYVVDASDSLVEGAQGGTDTVKADFTFTLATDFENLTLTGTADIDGTGNSAANHIIGNSGKNVLTGLGGIDTLEGGAGDDAYVVDTGDVIVENAGGGNDTVTTATTYTLGANLENLTLTGSANIDGTGSDDANHIIGNSGFNILTGGKGADTLESSGGLDSLIGGEGDDTYIVVAGDHIVEAAGEGTDLVKSGVTFTLGDHLESLTLTGTANIDGTGNAANNLITGNIGNNVLTGLGGVDTLVGGEGNDTYVVGPGDIIIELAGQGIDTLRTDGTYKLDPAASIEIIELIGTANFNLTGSNEANHLIGNAGNNILFGLGGNDTLEGGDGFDTLIGGDGDDTYKVDNGDVVVEAPGRGIDTVETDGSYTLGANLEHLTLTGTGNTAGIGNAVANHLVGNSGNNLLVGLGGADTLEGGEGHDALQGGAGNDLLLGGNGHDVLDGGAGADRMEGGDGNDVYYVTSSTDKVIETPSNGIDTVISSISQVLAANVENLNLTGTGYLKGVGNDLANIIVGNKVANLLDGAGDNDVLVGGPVAEGWTGRHSVDTMIGGPGNDTFVLGDADIAYYDDGTAAAGSLDYAVIKDFSIGDKLTLHGVAADYVVKEKGGIDFLYLDNGKSDGVFDTGDELIAKVHSDHPLDLNLDAVFV